MLLSFLFYHANKKIPLFSPPFSIYPDDLSSLYLLLIGVLLGHIFVQNPAAGGVIALADATTETSGAKAAACSHLGSLSSISEKGNLVLGI